MIDCPRYDTDLVIDADIESSPSVKVEPCPSIHEQYKTKSNCAHHGVWPAKNKYEAWPPEFETRVRTALWRDGYHTREQLAGATDDDLLAIRNLGKKALAKIRKHIPSPER